MKWRATLLFSIMCSAFVVGACEPTDAEAPPTATSDGPSLPPGFVVPPGSELERRIGGTCILFDAWEDGSGRRVCVLSTPQNGTLGHLTTEGEGLDGGGVASASEALRDGPPAELPTVVDHRAEYLDGCVTVSNQHNCAWCTEHAATAALEALYCSKGCDVAEVSEAHLRANSREGGDVGACANGWDIIEAAQTLVDTPIASAETWPYVPNTRGLEVARPPAAELQAAATYQATGFDRVDPADLEAIKSLLASGRDVILSVPLFITNERAFPDWLHQVARVADVTEPDPCGCDEPGCTGGTCRVGYHVVLLTGYNDDSEQFTFLNSWGKEFGDGGYGQMSYGFVRARGITGVALRDVRTDSPRVTCVEASEPDPDLPRADACAGALGCPECVGLSGCGWCEGQGCRDASTSADECPVWAPRMCASSSESCGGHANCGTCLAVDGCQWCGSANDGEGQCYDPSLRTIACADPRNAPDQCNDCIARDCEACADMEGCGWCPGNAARHGAPSGSLQDCVPGGDALADHSSCPIYRGDAATCTSDECRNMTDCVACLDNPGCGWCDGVGQCMAGDFTGPVSGGAESTTCGRDWDYFSPWCDNTPSSCEHAISCSECLWNTALGCGWDADVGGCAPAPRDGAGNIVTRVGDCPVACEGEGAACSDECCDGLSCVVGRCADCAGKRTLAEACDPMANDCCGGLTCGQMASGESACCTASFETCSNDAECCGDMTCSGGNCLCRRSGQSCQSGRECCGSSLCTGGTCS